MNKSFFEMNKVNDQTEKSFLETKKCFLEP